MKYHYLHLSLLIYVITFLIPFASQRRCRVEIKITRQNIPIYCHGELLKTVQLAEVFSDSKTFVDLYQLHDPSVTLANFEKFMSATGGNPNKTEVSKFVAANFHSSIDVLPWTPSDWQSNPTILERIQDPKYRQWAYQLNFVWLNLSRQMSPEIIARPERYSAIPLENGFIVPGGRFQETYYWDSYWVIEGLLISGMKETAKGIILNFISMVNRFGFIPNGGRVYYLMRSQPPLLIPMVEKYIEATGDIKFLSDNLLTLEKEFAFFIREKTIEVTKNNKTHKMARYVVNSDGPRPESYREDFKEAQNFDSIERRKTFYEDIKAGAESGWDFSSRWFIPSGPGLGNLSDISTRNIIPVDLNAFLQRNARLLSQFNQLLGNEVKARKYRNIAIDYQNAIDDILWNEELGIWLDYDMKNGRPRKFFYPSNLTPLYTRSFDRKNASTYAQKVVDYLKAEGIDSFMGGTPTSLTHTGEQWDWPNAWPPLQSIMVQGLRNLGIEPALSMAKELAMRWLKANYIGFQEGGVMYEKYSAIDPGKYGGGGEYDVQAGFGWTNGIVFEFLDTYPDAKS
ncbi:trehalase-like isoform X1 [Microplitis mediator]|uniref:trehalase-like isoform X1 n=1 Tax=Microplitis mediator TaxID=375433 RepID=UPI0025579436|nr:trehalase-like isoform X1 [Microplitis mediator]